MLAVTWLNSQIIFDGVVQGLGIAVIAVGVVLVYRATRIINFAVGNMGVVGAAVLSLLVVQYHVPFWVGLVVALILGLVFGAVVDLAIIRRLRKSPRVVVLVATIGVSQLALAIAIKIPTPTAITTHFPSAINGTWTVAGVTVRGSDLSILIIVPITLIALTWFLDRTTLGRTVKACSSNPRLARLSGISPKMVSTLVWALAAALSTLSVILIAGQSGAAGDLTTLGPQTLSLALVAAVIGGMTSFSRTIVASVVIGVLQSIVNFNYIDEPGLINLLLLIIVVVAVLFNRERTDESEVFAFTPRARPIPVRLQSSRWARNINKSGIFFLGAIAIVLPLIFTQPSTQQTFTEILAFAICATSLTVLTGWLGQLSLGQMAFAGLGALFAARLVEGGVPFWLAIVATTAGSAVLALILGLSSLRVKGLYLAVVTFVFALAAQQYFFSLGILSGGSSDGSDLPFVPGKLFSLSFPGQRTYYYVVLVILAVVLLIANRFRDSGIGRSIMAVRDNENAASAYRVRPVWEKIRAFAIAGALAGMGGALLSGAYSNVAFGGPGSFFIVDISLSLVAMVVIGGMGSVTAAVIGAIWVIGIPALAPNNQVLGLLTSSIGLLAVLLYFPRGLMQVAYDARDALLNWADRRFGKDVVPVGAEDARQGGPAGARTPRGWRADTGCLRSPGELRRERRRRWCHRQRERTRDRRAHRKQRGRQVDADERDRGLRPGVGIRATRRRGDRRSSARLPGRPGSGPDLPVGDLVPRVDGDADTAGGAGGEERDRHALHRARLAAGHAAEPARPRRRGRPRRSPRSGVLPGPLHRRPLHRDPPSGRAGGTAGPRCQGPLPRRADCGTGATRDRGLRAAHRHRAAAARRVGPPH